MSDLLDFYISDFTNSLFFSTAIVFFIAGVVKGSIGMGLPLVSISLLSLYTSPRLAMMLIIVPTLVTNFLQYYRSARKTEMVLSNRFLLGSLFVCTVASSFFSFPLEQKTLSFLLGITICIFIIYRWLGFFSSCKIVFDKITQIISGAVIGTVAGFTHVWAPTIVVLLMLKKANKEQFVGLTGLYIFVGSLGLFFTHYFYDLLDREIFSLSAIMMFPSIFGFIVGEKIRSFISEQFFETLLLIFLLIASINLLYKSDFIAYFIKTFGKS